MSPNKDLVLTEVIDQHVLLITINRPERRNAFDAATLNALQDAVERYEADDQLWCAILTGSTIVFSAGADLIAAREGDPNGSPRNQFGFFQDRPTKPLIAAIEGYALAGGLELALSCDLIVASRTAKMGLPEAARSLVAIGGGCFRLPKRIPYHLAMELILTGKPWLADRFAQIGLVNRLTEPGEALAGARELAADVVAAGPLGVRASKQLAMRAFDWTDEEAWAHQFEYTQDVFASEDLQEGLIAFAEKRPAVWKGR